VRLRDWEVAAIRQSAAEAFGPHAVVRLFGSRLDDRRRGGDIDLHLECCEATLDHNRRALFARRLQERLGERAIDIVYAPPHRALRPIDQVAISEGLIL
jgi:hypothetical protein